MASSVPKAGVYASTPYSAVPSPILRGLVFHLALTSPSRSSADLGFVRDRGRVPTREPPNRGREATEVFISWTGPFSRDDMHMQLAAYDTSGADEELLELGMGHRKIADGLL